MDPFKSEFDPRNALKNMDCLEEQPCSSIKTFEHEFLKEMPEILINFQKIEKLKKEDVKTLKKPNNKERLKRLEDICVDGALPVIKIPKKILQRRVKQIEGKGFVLHSGNIYDCMEKWLTNRNRICLKLLSSNAKEPNRFLEGIIVAFDKHWNLLLRDIEETYIPARRLRKVQTSTNAMPNSVIYSIDETSTNNNTILYRHLKCSLIMGNSIICMCKKD